MNINKKIQKMEEAANDLMESFIGIKNRASQDPNTDTEMFKYLFDTTGNDYVRLKERFKHDEKKLLELATDWADYSIAIFSMLRASNHKMRELDNGRGIEYWNQLEKNFSEEVKEPLIIREEIEKRFQELLGFKFSDRLKEWLNKANSSAA